MLKFLIEFCDVSSIHGLRYFTERNRHWTEKLWWLIAFSLSVSLCGLSIRDIWMNWSENPVTMRFSEKDIPISSIPFPTVTICSQAKIKRDKVDITSIYLALENNSRNITEEESFLWQILENVCPFRAIYRLPTRYHFFDDSFYFILAELFPFFHEIISECNWNKLSLPCAKLFQPVWYKEGLCYSFNALNSHEMYRENVAFQLKTVKSNPNISHWTPDGGYEAEVNETSFYPFRAFDSTVETSLFTLLTVTTADINYNCALYEGFNFYFSLPGEAAVMSRPTIQAPLSMLSTILITPKLITTSENLRNYAPNQRGCFFNFERQLHFFKIYTQLNCEQECLSNYTKIECDCVEFSLPRENGTLICGGGKVYCHRMALNRFYEVDGLTDDAAKLFREQCNCLPSCTAITYDAEIDKEAYDFNAILRSENNSVEGFSGKQSAMALVLFKEDHIVTLHRSALYTYVDFLSICGGLLGLFLGVSVLSIVEFIYFFSLRLLCTILQSRAQNTVVPLQTSNRSPQQVPNSSISIDIPS